MLLLRFEIRTWYNDKLGSKKVCLQNGCMEWVKKPMYVHPLQPNSNITAVMLSVMIRKTIWRKFYGFINTPSINGRWKMSKTIMPTFDQLSIWFLGNDVFCWDVNYLNYYMTNCRESKKCIESTLAVYFFLQNSWFLLSNLFEIETLFMTKECVNTSWKCLFKQSFRIAERCRNGINLLMYSSNRRPYYQKYTFYLFSCGVIRQNGHTAFVFLCSYYVHYQNGFHAHKLNSNTDTYSVVS